MLLTVLFFNFGYIIVIARKCGVNTKAVVINENHTLGIIIGALKLFCVILPFARQAFQWMILISTLCKSVVTVIRCYYCWRRSID